MTTMDPARDLKADLQKLLRDGDHSDFTIKCGHYTARVHKAIISARSPVLKKACSTTWQEGCENLIDLTGGDLPYHLSEPSADAVAINRMICYIYTGDYSYKNPYDHGLPKNMDTDELLLHIKLYALGDKYEMPGLMQLALAMFKIKVEDLEWDTSAFCRVIDMAFETALTPDAAIKDHVVTFLNWKKRNGGLDKKLEDKIEEHPLLAMMLWKSVQ